MVTRDILDYQGNTIGQLTLPDETTEESWIIALSQYSAPPSVPPPIISRVTSYISDARQFAISVADQFAAENSMLGIKQSGKTGAVMDYLHEMVHCVLSGSLNEAVLVLDRYIADQSDAKANLAPFITDARLTDYKNKIQDYLVIPRT